jgi:transcription initiation factor TFIID subunit 10
MASHNAHQQQHSNNGQQQNTNGPVSNGGTSASFAAAQAANDSTQIPPQPPLSDFMLQLEDYTPTIPDAVTKHYLATSGFDTTDPRVLRLVSLAAQKFVSDVANDALQHCKMRNAGQAVAKNNKNKDRKFVMTMEDLGQALGNQGVTVKKPPYYT